MAKAKKAASALDLVVPETAKNTNSKNPVVYLEAPHDDEADRYKEVVARLKEIEAEKNVLYSSLKKLGQQIWTRLAAKTGKLENPRLRGKTSGLLFILANSFNAITDEKLEAIEKAGMQHHLEPTGISLAPDLTEEEQGRIAKAVLAEFGKEEFLRIIKRNWTVKPDALKKIVEESRDEETIAEAIELLDPRQQLRTE